MKHRGHSRRYSHKRGRRGHSRHKTKPLRFVKVPRGGYRM